MKYGIVVGIVVSIKSSFERINIIDDFDKKLIGFVGDGVIVNRGERELSFFLSMIIYGLFMFGAWYIGSSWF